MKHIFGTVVRDKITGFTGTATAYAVYWNANPSVFVEPHCDDKTHEKPVPKWIDELRLEEVKA